jgi:hypothetical protein
MCVRSAESGRPEEIAIAVGDQASVRILAIRIAEADQGFQRIAAGGVGELEDGAVSESSALFGRPKQVAVGIGDQASVRKCTTGPVEVEIDQGDRRGGIDARCVGNLEDGAIGSAASRDRSRKLPYLFPHSPFNSRAMVVSRPRAII